MKLDQIFEQAEKIYAFWKHKVKGPEDVIGDALHYIQANKKYKPNDPIKRDGPFYTPSVGWWMSKEDFESGEQGVHAFKSPTKDDIKKKFPNLVIVDSYQEAVKKSGF